MLPPGSVALVSAGPGVDQALHRRGVHVVREGDADAVVVGRSTDFDYRRMTVAARAVLRGARLVGTNDDATFPTPEGPVPGGGAILASIAVVAGVTPEIAGKPHEPMVALLRGRGDRIEVVVGDRPSTDGLLARRLGARFALVLTGVTPAGKVPADPSAHLVAPDLASVVDRWLTGQ